MTNRVTTKFKTNALAADVADYLYTHLLETVTWEDGIRSKNGFTRKALMVSAEDELFETLIPYVDSCLEQLTTNKYLILGLYLNYYKNGEMYTPNHSHKGTHQLVISLGTERTLIVGKKEYKMGNGDAIIFGSSVHGVPKSDTTKGRISIATFMV